MGTPRYRRPAPLRSGPNPYGLTLHLTERPTMPDPRPTPLARLTRRARQAAAALQQEYEAGKQGDTAPPAPIWPTPGEQLDAVMRLLRPSDERGRHGSSSPTSGAADEGIDADLPFADTPDRPIDSQVDSQIDSEVDAASMNAAIRVVDWTKVREATADRTSGVARAAQQLADQVDWAKVQPRAAQVSRAVIAAVAAGQLGVGGRIGGIVARTIVDQGGLADRVGGLLETEPEQLRHDVSRVVIDTTASDG